MTFFSSFIHNHNKGAWFRSSLEKNQDSNRNSIQIPFGVQEWSYYRDLVIESGHCSISSELSSLRYSHLERSLYNLIYTPNDELNYFTLYMESCSLSSYLKFILDTNTFNKIVRENLYETNSNEDQQTAALTLFHRYLSLDANYLVPINDEIRRTTLSLICPLNDSTKPDPDCFRMARDHIWQLIEQNIYPEYLQSTYHLNYQLKLLTSNQLKLHDILYHRSSLLHLIKFAEQENIIDLLQFLIDAEHFHQNIIDRNIDNKTLTDSALNIYDRYMSLQAPLRLGFDDAIRARIECSICQADIDAGPSLDTFDQTAWIVYMIFQREYFPKFLQSIIFYRYISDLMLKLRHQQSLLRIKTFHSMDTISIESEDLIPLDKETNRSKSASCTNINQEITTHSKGKLSMGYVDSLGRFIRNSDVDSTDSLLLSNRKTYSKPLQYLTQFVRHSQDEITTEEEEEEAVRFAETFINEITNRTMNDTDE